MAQTINWPSLSTAFSELSKNKEKEVLKWHSGFRGTNSALKMRNHAQSSECPGCNHPNETTDHVIKCKAAGATKIWNSKIEKLLEWMKANQGAPELIKAIKTGLIAWRNNQPNISEKYTLPFLNAAVDTQNSIGWKGFIHGFTSKHWERAQQNFLHFKSSRTSGKRWISALIKKLWEVIWALWQYRNGLVHEQTNTPLRKINALLNITILKELQPGLSGVIANLGEHFFSIF